MGSAGRRGGGAWGLSGSRSCSARLRRGAQQCVLLCACSIISLGCAELARPAHAGSAPAAWVCSLSAKPIERAQPANGTRGVARRTLARLRCPASLVGSDFLSRAQRSQVSSVPAHARPAAVSPSCRLRGSAAQQAWSALTFYLAHIAAR